MELCFKPLRMMRLMWGADVRSFGWVVLALFLMATPGDTATDCRDILPSAFSNPLVPGVCYASAINQMFPFQAAVDFCRSLSGGSWSVVDIEDADENLFLEVWNRDNFRKNSGYWIGQNDREQEGDYRYTSSGRCPVYLNWYENQPNGARGQNCMVMFKQEDGCFQDKDCSEMHYTLCKLKIDPEPTRDPLTRCNGSALPREETACSDLRPGAFGSVAKPGMCYFMTDLELTWESAVEYCQGEGWTLVDVEDATENALLATRHRDFKPNNNAYWIGQNDREEEGVYNYTSSEQTPVYLNWRDGQPNDDGSQDCVVMFKSDGGLFQDKDCSANYFTLCKLKIEPTTKDSCSNNMPAPRPRKFLFLSADATCRPEDVLTPSYRVKTRVQCARDCSMEAGCKSFGFLTSGNEDNCVLCSKVLNIYGIVHRAGSVVYTKA